MSDKVKGRLAFDLDLTGSPHHLITSSPHQSAEAPLDWAYAHFPLQGEGEELLSLEWVVQLAHERIDRAAESGDEAYTGSVLHWAHILKIEQGPNGDWPAFVNARTGAAAGAARTRAPAGLMARLDALHDATEFEIAVGRAERLRKTTE